MNIHISVQPCLGGDGKTLMFVNVNPEAASLQETVCSLRFATKVNACQTAARGGAKRHMSVEARSSLQVPLEHCIPLYFLSCTSILVTVFFFVPHSLFTTHALDCDSTHENSSVCSDMPTSSDLPMAVCCQYDFLLLFRPHRGSLVWLAICHCKLTA